MNQTTRPQVIIIGGGFGGLACAVSLRRTDADILLIDKQNVHTFQPLLYQVATAGLSPANITTPIRNVLGRQKNARVMMSSITKIDVDQQTVWSEQEGSIRFDYLVMAVGARTSYFGNEEWARHAPGLKDVEDALDMRQRILGAFEQAEWCSDKQERQKLMRVVVIGGGPTGVELAGAVAELAHHTLVDDFKNIDTRKVEVHLIEGGNRLLAMFPESLSERTKQDLEALNVTIHIQSKVEDISADKVIFRNGEECHELNTATILWGAGVAGQPLLKTVADQCDIELASGGRLPVTKQCAVPGKDNIWAIGDCAACSDGNDVDVPGLAPAALQQGRYVAQMIDCQLKGKSFNKSFAYRDKGSMATIGRNRAVASSMGLELKGYLAWLAWLFIHLLYLVGYQNRFLVLCQWAWNYITRGRSSRLLRQRRFDSES